MGMRQKWLRRTANSSQGLARPETCPAEAGLYVPSAYRRGALQGGSF